jgi:hypothetical protein
MCSLSAPLLVPPVITANTHIPNITLAPYIQDAVTVNPGKTISPQQEAVLLSEKFNRVKKTH